MCYAHESAGLTDIHSNFSDAYVMPQSNSPSAPGTVRGMSECDVVVSLRRNALLLPILPVDRIQLQHTHRLPSNKLGSRRRNVGVCVYPRAVALMSQKAPLHDCSLGDLEFLRLMRARLRS